MIVRSSAPGKLILFGEHASSRGKPAIVFAVNQRLAVTIRKCQQHKILLTSHEFNVIKEEYPSTKLDVVTNIIAHFFKTNNLSEKPIEIEISSTIKPGFGSSAALIVALLGALYAYFDIKLSKLEMLKLCIDFNVSLKGYGSGLDIATALYGGLIKFQKGRKPEPLPYEGLNILIGNTGIKAPSGPIVRDVREFEKKNPIRSKQIFNRIAEIVSEAEDAILNSDLQTIGMLMNENHTLLQQLNVSSKILDEMVQIATSNGALGAKLSGAGKGDNMIALLPNDFDFSNISTKLNKTTGSALPEVKIEKSGLKIELDE